MNGYWQRWVQASYSQRRLLQVALGILALGLVLACLVSGRFAEQARSLSFREAELGPLARIGHVHLLERIADLDEVDRASLLRAWIAHELQQAEPAPQVLIRASAALGALAGRSQGGGSNSASVEEESSSDSSFSRSREAFEPHWPASARTDGRIQAAQAAYRSAQAMVAAARALPRALRVQPGAERQAALDAAAPWLPQRDLLTAPRHAFFTLGATEEALGRPLAAAADYAQEARLHEDPVAAALALHLWLEAGAYQAAADWLPDTPFATHLGPRLRQQLAAAQGAWQEVLSWVPRVWWRGVQATPVPLVLLAGVGGFFWWAFLIRFATPGTRWRRALAFSLLGLLLGAFSTQAVLFWGAITRLHFGWGYDPVQDPAMRGVLHAILGIGLPEEVFKLLGFALLLPLLLRWGRPSEALLAAGCVGLGFAVEENLQYFTASNALAAGSRFLTANFLHMALTGLAGFHLYWAARDPVRHGARAAEALGLVVVVHGLYNALLMVPALTDYSLLAMSVHVLIGYGYFRLLHEQQTIFTLDKRWGWSLTSLFSVGLSLMLAGSWIYCAALVGVWSAAEALLTQMLGVGLITLMFFREVREPLRP